jgi:hypothetical protein
MAGHKFSYSGRIERQQKFMIEFETSGSIKHTCLAVGIKYGTYEMWRREYPEFKAKIDEIKVKKGFGQKGMSKVKPEDLQERWSSVGFADFRKQWFKMDTPAFQIEIVEAYENTEPGKITLILIPPEHGKTTLFEDYAVWKLATDPSYRFTVGSESQSMSRKILARVKNRLDPEGPFPYFVQMFGPFVPQTSSQMESRGEGIATSKTRQPWGQDYFNVYKKGGQDERDYSMVALGIGSQIAGTRTDHLHIDDVMSLKNLTQADGVLEIIRQDWLSRPGQRGRTTVNGTRVGIDDVYELMEEAFDEDILQIIKLPALRRSSYTKKLEPLWPYDEETGWGWTPEMLDRQRRTVGESAWDRNYMQKPSAKGAQTFQSDIVENTFNPLRSLTHTDPDPDNGPLYVGLDPSIGGSNVFTVNQAGEKFTLWDIREDFNLTSNADMARVLEELLLKFTVRGCFVSDVVIEEMAFQKGLLNDDAFIELRNRWGFAIRGHSTGSNKYDPNFGVASMVHHMANGTIDLPGADDSYTRQIRESFVKELYKWRPYKRGTRLKQDQVMAFWFPYIVWMQRRRSNSQASKPEGNAWRGQGLGYDPTKARVLTGGMYS